MSVGKKRGTALSFRKEQVMLYLYNVITINGFIYKPPNEICEQITSTPYRHWSLGTDPKPPLADEYLHRIKRWYPGELPAGLAFSGVPKSLDRELGALTTRLTL